MKFVVGDDLRLTCGISQYEVSLICRWASVLTQKSMDNSMSSLLCCQRSAYCCSVVRRSIIGDSVFVYETLVFTFDWVGAGVM